MELTSTQKKHLKSIKWLTSHEHIDIGTGRTTLLAYAFIQDAIAHPGTRVFLWNHSPMVDSKRYVMETARKMLETWDEFKNLDYYFKMSNMTLTVRGVKK